MAGTGPTPKAAGVDGRGARRRNATIAMTRLPAGGRQGAAPRWPLLDDIVLTERRDSCRRNADELELLLLEPELVGRARASAQRKYDSANTAANIADAQLKQQQQVEGELWAELWATPQATAWERMGWIREVAQYVRWKVKAEGGDLDASKEARMLADRLGLNPLSMLRLRWEIAPDEVAEQRTDRAAAGRPRAQRRLKIADPGVAGA